MRHPEIELAIANAEADAEDGWKEVEAILAAYLGAFGPPGPGSERELVEGAVRGLLGNDGFVAKLCKVRKLRAFAAGLRRPADNRAPGGPAR